MVRTAATAARVPGGKSSGKKGRASSSSSASSSSASTSSSSKGGQSSSSIGGNPVCPRETPAWQKPITNFFRKNDSSEEKNHKIEMGESSKSRLNVSVETEISSQEMFENKKNEFEEKEVEANVSSSSNNGASTENIIEFEDVQSSQGSKKSIKADSEETEIQSDSTEKINKDTEDTKENRGELQQIGSPSCSTPTSERKRRGNHINILTPKRIKGQY